MSENNEISEFSKNARVFRFFFQIYQKPGHFRKFGNSEMSEESEILTFSEKSELSKKIQNL